MAEQRFEQTRSKVNDFALKLANVNGTGSSSANNLLMRSIFRMGVPVSGKNLFPSNIQGLPTWYEIRVNAAGHTSRARDFDLMVAMHTSTYAADVGDGRSDGYLVWDATWPMDSALVRSDITYLGVPVARMCAETFRSPRERTLMQNIVSAGAVVALLDIDLDTVS